MKITQLVATSVAAVAVFSSCWAAAHSSVRLELLPREELQPGRNVEVEAKLIHSDDGLAITDEQLKTVHTQKFHLLVIDPTLTDYHHIHPELSATPGNYRFTFTPKFASGYKAWADVTPKSTGKQEFAEGVLGDTVAPKINKTESYNVTVNGYHFELAFDEKPTRGKASMGTIHITDDNDKEVKNLAPVMGAFAHIVGFYDDFEHIVHIHPMGKEPEKTNERSGPDIEFHMEPTQAGFIKMFVQVNIDGKEIFAPFGVKVEK